VQLVDIYRAGNMDAMNLFVTGASGYIGTEAIAALHASGHSSVSLARSESSTQKLSTMGSLPYL
jgi:uncharacterized protein YbjT (DUF2867 family)